MATIDKLAGKVGAAMKRAGMTKPATLIVVTAGARTPGAVSAGTNPTEQSFGARGLVVRWTRTRLNQTDVQVGDRVVKLFASLIVGGQVPKIGDKITIEGVTGRIIDIARNAASYDCLTRK